MAMDPTQPTAPTGNPAQPAQVKPPMTPPGGAPGGIAPPTSFTPPQTPTSVPTLGPATTQAGTINMTGGGSGTPNDDPANRGMGQAPVSGQLNTAGLALPPVTADNWQGADARIAQQQQGMEAAHAAAGQQDVKNGYNAFESQDQLNARRGLTVNPANGAFDDPNTRPGGNAAAQLSQVQAQGQGAQQGGGIKPPTDFTPPQTPMNVPTLGPATTQAGTGGASASPSGPAAPPAAPSTPLTGVGLGGIDPTRAGGDLRGSSILPTDQVDRQKLAESRFNTFNQATDPAYQASLRSATQRGAASGTMGSGMLNTSYGDLALQRGRDLDSQKSMLMQNALEGSIGDSRNNRDEYRGERGYQNGLENQGYNRGMNALDQEDRLTNSAYGRASGNFSAGTQNNPANYQMLLSQIYGKNATTAGSAAAAYASQRAANNAVRGQSGTRGDG